MFLAGPLVKKKTIKCGSSSLLNIVEESSNSNNTDRLLKDFNDFFIGTKGVTQETLLRIQTRKEIKAGEQARDKREHLVVGW